MKSNRLSFSVSVARGLCQLCILLIVFSICHTAYARTNGRILPDSPSDGHLAKLCEKIHPEYGKLMGRVFQPTDSGCRDRRTPIEGASVLLLDTNTRPVAETTTSRSGRFAFKKVPFGDYILTVEKEGYISAREEVTVQKPGPGSRRPKFVFNVPLYPELAEALWGGTNNGDIFDEQGPIIDEMLDQLAKANLRVLRIIIDYRLEMDEDGNPLPLGEYNDCILTWIDRLMLKAREKGILLLITLQIHNWITDAPIKISKENYEWRKCKTPYNVYQTALDTGLEQSVQGPYAARGWSHDYLTSTAAKKAYKERVYHILNHYNYFLEKKWKDINDVVWAWGLQGEPDLLLNSPVNVLRDWYDEMATHVKSIDPDTYVVLGTKWPNTAVELGNIEDVDIYTFHAYEGISDLDKDIKEFQDEIGNPYGKLLLVEEFNPGAEKRHTPDYQEYRAPFEEIMEVCRKNGVPWMFWEHGYGFDDDDVWHANGVTSETWGEEEHLDGVFWGAKVLPGAKRIWQTFWDWSGVGKTWNVHKIVNNICSESTSLCGNTDMLYFIDTFSTSGELSNEYDVVDEDIQDNYYVPGEGTDFYGYLRIEAAKWQDLWGGNPPQTGAPLVLHDVPGGFYSVETFVSADPLMEYNTKPVQTLNTQMGLFVYQDFDNWIFFGLTNHDFTIGGTNYQEDGLILTVTVDGASSIVAIDDYPEDFVFLKIDKYTGFPNGYRFFWKRENGEPWQYMFAVLFTFENDRVGMGVKTLDVFPNPGFPGRANFDYFLIGSP